MDNLPVQTKREIEAVLTGIGMHPRKMFGQNFLIDGNLMRLLVKSADISPGDRVLEVGGATGGLTDLLAKLSTSLYVVEIDRDLAVVLKERFAHCEHLTILNADALHQKHLLHGPVGAWVSGESGSGDRPVKLVANLPYEVATLIVMNLLIDYPMVSRLCFTVQLEVGQRIAAMVNTKAYGPLSIIAQTLAEVEMVARVPASAFWPRPKIDSAIMRLTRKPSPFAMREQQDTFVRVVRRAFEHRRKTLRSAISYYLDKDICERICQDFDGQCRPQTLSAEEWVSLSRLVPEVVA